MKTWSFYDRQTGLLTGCTFTGRKASLDLNLKAGQGAIEGDHDHLSRKVNLDTGELEDYVPPAPDEHHAWNEEQKRWVLKPAVQEARAKRVQALTQIAQLEARQPRALREMALGHEGATQRLQAIEDQIASLRQLLS